MELGEDPTPELRRLYAKATSPDPKAIARVFDPDRLMLARERAGWTRRDLATRLGEPTSTVLSFERGRIRPTGEELVRLATGLGLPLYYFRASDPVLPITDECAYFRKIRTTRQYERRQALVVANHLADLVRNLSRFVVRLPEVNVPRLPQNAWTPERRVTQGARLVREAWGVGDDPFWHLIRHMEVNGIVVSLADFGSAPRIDAFACEPPGLDRPLVCLALDKQDPLRRRFNAAHELGHLVLHSDVPPGGPGLEEEADQFAMELLMPASMRDQLPFRDDFRYWRWVQTDWGVSMPNLLRRAVQVGRMKQKMYERCMRIWKRFRMRDEEPVGGDYADEWPAMLSRAVDAAAPYGLNAEVVAVQLGLPHSDVLDLLGLEAQERPRLGLVQA